MQRGKEVGQSAFRPTARDRTSHESLATVGSTKRQRSGYAPPPKSGAAAVQRFSGPGGNDPGDRRARKLRDVHPSGNVCQANVGCLQLRDDPVVDPQPLVTKRYTSYQGHIYSELQLRYDRVHGYCSRLMLKYSLNASSWERGVLRSEIAQQCPGLSARLDSRDRSGPEARVVLPQCSWASKAPLFHAAELDGRRYKELLAAFAELNLTWVPKSGTALGMFRHHGIIPDDLDMDAMLPAWLNTHILSVAPASFSPAQLRECRSEALHPVLPLLRRNLPVYGRHTSNASQFAEKLVGAGLLWTLCGLTTRDWLAQLRAYVLFKQQQGLGSILTLKSGLEMGKACGECVYAMDTPATVYASLKSQQPFHLDLRLSLTDVYMGTAAEPSHYCRCPRFYPGILASDTVAGILCREDWDLQLFSFYGATYMKPDRLVAATNTWGQAFHWLTFNEALSAGSEKTIMLVVEPLSCSNCRRVGALVANSTSVTRMARAFSMVHVLKSELGKTQARSKFGLDNSNSYPRVFFLGKSVRYERVRMPMACPSSLCHDHCGS